MRGFVLFLYYSIHRLWSTLSSLLLSLSCINRRLPERRRSRYLPPRVVASQSDRQETFKLHAYPFPNRNVSATALHLQKHRSGWGDRRDAEREYFQKRKLEKTVLTRIRRCLHIQVSRRVPSPEQKEIQPMPMTEDSFDIYNKFISTTDCEERPLTCLDRPERPIWTGEEA